MIEGGNLHPDCMLYVNYYQNDVAKFGILSLSYSTVEGGEVHPACMLYVNGNICDGSGFGILSLSYLDETAGEGTPATRMTVRRLLTIKPAIVLSRRKGNSQFVLNNWSNKLDLPSQRLLSSLSQSPERSRG